MLSDGSQLVASIMVPFCGSSWPCSHWSFTETPFPQVLLARVGADDAGFPVHMTCEIPGPIESDNSNGSRVLTCSYFIEYCTHNDRLLTNKAIGCRRQ